MKNKSKIIKSFIISNVKNHPKDIVTYTAKHFKVTRTTVHRHLTSLLKQDKIIKSGTTRQTIYCLATSFDQQISFQISPSLAEMAVWQKNFVILFHNLPKNVFNICEYGFLEIFNNHRSSWY